MSWQTILDVSFVERQSKPTYIHYNELALSLTTVKLSRACVCLRETVLIENV